MTKPKTTISTVSSVADACAIEVTSIELHLGSSPDLPKRYGRKIKAMGGSYRAARGHDTTRFVHIPATDEGLALCDVLRDQFGSYFRTGQRVATVIFRGPETRNLQAWQHVFSRGDSWVSVRLDLADMLRAWDVKMRDAIANPDAHCHAEAARAARAQKSADAVNPALAAEVDPHPDADDDDAPCETGRQIPRIPAPCQKPATDMLTDVLASLTATLKDRAVIDELKIGMELKDISPGFGHSRVEAVWFACCQVRGRRLRSGRQEWSLAYGSGATIDEAVAALIEDVDDWIAMFKVDAKLAEQRKTARK
jgi:hypothetical protein